MSEKREGSISNSNRKDVIEEREENISRTYSEYRKREKRKI